MYQQITCTSAPGFETENKISYSGGKEDDTQMSMEEMVILKEESRMLQEKIGKLSLQEQFIIKSIYFDDMKQKDVAEILGVTKGALSQRLNTILRKMRNMYMEG